MTSAAPVRPRKDDDWIEAIWASFVSLRMTLYLLVALAAASALGTFLSPVTRPEELQARLGDGALALVGRFFELGDLFHSWWFTVLLWGLAFNLIACTVERLPKVWRLALKGERRLTEAVLRERRHVSRFALSPAGKPNASAIEVVAQAMRKQGYLPGAVERDGDTVYLFAERGRLSRFGAHVTHLALLVILFGGIVGRLGGAQGLAEIRESGEGFGSVPVIGTDGRGSPRKLGFWVQATDFRLLSFADGSPRQYETDLEVWGAEGDELALRKTISINHPMHFGGWTFYQASYRVASEARKARIEITDRATGKRRQETLLVDDAVTMADGARLGLVGGEDDHAGAGPAVHLAREQDGVVTDFWVFQAFPGFDAANRDDRWSVDLVGFEPVYLTGIQVVRDPGADIVFFGCLLLALGLAQSFYSAHRRIWARVDAQEVVLAGSSHRGPQQFAREFAQLSQAVGRGLS
ncbi:MAG: cytochrome c biogenesis protein ResB [Myxococcales bacterium]